MVFISTTSVQAWDNCPFGEVNEPYPGTCGRYTDTDRDGICDLSQPPPDTRNEANTDNNENSLNSSLPATSTVSSSRLNYYFVPIAILLFVLYGITYTLSHKQIIKKSKHKKIWNLILLITFLVSGSFGIILAILISYGIRLDFYSDLLFWHVEFGIAMSVISMFHVAWHWKYYKKMIKK